MEKTVMKNYNNYNWIPAAAAPVNLSEQISNVTHSPHNRRRSRNTASGSAKTDERSGRVGATDITAPPHKVFGTLSLTGNTALIEPHQLFEMLAPDWSFSQIYSD
ncbi:hypothetical protein JOB18_046107 [Solea senegalensis]|uniref:Uncharacterized protein n=1 Tax=Solea senegalensis TaxID=28829 RepID=A0AAV6SIV1_SOLSE|nr:hypothetical protein JOB18_046107 [Solea senegalensis]